MSVEPLMNACSIKILAAILFGILLMPQILPKKHLALNDYDSSCRESAISKKSYTIPPHQLVTVTAATRRESEAPITVRTIRTWNSAYIHEIGPSPSRFNLLDSSVFMLPLPAFGGAFANRKMDSDVSMGPYSQDTVNHKSPLNISSPVFPGDTGGFYTLGGILSGVDYSWGRPNVNQLFNLGYAFVVRYVGGTTGSGKNISYSEAQAITAAGLEIVLVFESTASRIRDGYNAGVTDAGIAVSQANAAGAPPGFFCYFACDYDAPLEDQTRINDYLDGASSVLGRSRVGIYGGYWPVKRALDSEKASKAWQTYAWSGGNKDPRVSIYQYLNGQTVAGATVDLNYGYGADYGQWGYAGADTTDPTIANFSVGPPSVTLGNSFTMSFRASDAGGSGLDSAQIWWTTDNGGSPDANNWAQYGTSYTLVSSGNGPVDKTYSITPPVGTYWFGLHLDDQAGNSSTESDFGFRPQRVTISGGGTTSLTYQRCIVHDGIGGGVGNDDGLINAGEEIDIDVYLSNTGSATVTGVNASLSSNSPYVTITDANENWPDILPGDSEPCGSDFDFAVSSSTPAGHTINFTLFINSDQGTWDRSFSLEVIGSGGGGQVNLEYFSYQIDDDTNTSNGNNDGEVNPGETIELPVTLRNTGIESAHNVQAILSTSSPYVTITDDDRTWGIISGGATDESSDFDFVVDESCPDGHAIQFYLSITSDEGSWSDAFTIVVVGNEIAPEIAVEQLDGTNLMDESSTISFGDLVVGKGKQQTFKVVNTGNANLGGVVFTKDGADTADFTVTSHPLTVSAPGGSLAPGRYTTFVVNFSPTSVGVRTAAIRIASNDANENPFDIALAGNGIEPEIAVERLDGMNLVDGVSTVSFGDRAVGTGMRQTFKVINMGDANLSGIVFSKVGTNAADFTVTSHALTVAAPGGSLAPDRYTTFVVNFTPTSAGPKTATIRIASNDSNETPFDIALAGNGIGPEIAVKRTGGVEVFDGGPEVPFGALPVGSSSRQVFAINNTGNANMSGIVITKDGPDASDFAVTSHPLTVTAPGGSLAPGRYTSFVVNFTPTSAGVRTAAIRIASNDANENPFDIALAGNGIGPEIAVERLDGMNLVDGVSAVSFGDRAVGTGMRQTFKVMNTGDANLSGIVFSKVGKHAADFTVTSHALTVAAPGGSLAPGRYTTFVVNFTPTSAGPKTATIRITSNDSNENPFDIALAGRGIGPEIAVKRTGGVEVFDGGPEVPFDALPVGSSSRQVFAINNIGNANMSGIVITKDGSDASDFAVTSNPLTITAPGGSLAPGRYTTFVVNFTPTSAGMKTATIRIASNDADENPFDIALAGSGIGPEIAVERTGGVEVFNGGPEVPFGALPVGSSSRQVFTINNTGNANMSGIVITKDGSDASDFAVTSNPLTVSAPGGSLAPGRYTTFVVNFIPTSAGLKTAAIRIASNDANENPFDIYLTGTGISGAFKTAMYAKAADMDSASQSLKVQGKRNFKPVQVGTTGKVLAYTVQLPENTTADSVKICMVGEDARSYQLIKPTEIQQSRDGRLTFQVAFHPLTPGTKTASIRISGIRPDGKFVRRIKLKGNGSDTSAGVKQAD
jgi:Domain of unknown function (DUF1906)/Abnormal spindle-like microcephaly-assoc'd, ASPM-SPD-2-Hydin